MSACIYSDKYVQFWLLHSTYIIDGQRCITSNFFSKVQLVLFLRMTSRRVTLNWYLTVFCVMHHWPSTFCNTQRRNFCVFYKLLREFFYVKKTQCSKINEKVSFFNFYHLNFTPKFSIREFQSVENSLLQNVFLMSFLAWKFTWDNFWVIFKQRRIINQLLFIARESFFFFCGEGEGVATVGNWFSRWLSFNCDYFLITT